jgi:hypothetical protein
MLLKVNFKFHFTFYNKNEKYIPYNKKRISDTG